MSETLKGHRTPQKAEHVDVFAEQTEEQVRTYANVLVKEPQYMLPEVSSLDLVNELRRRNVIVPINGSEYANEIDYQHNKDRPHFIALKERYAASEAGRQLEDKRFTQHRMHAVHPSGVTLTPEEVDLGARINLRRFDARAWVVDLTKTGEADQ